MRLDKLKVGESCYSVIAEPKSRFPVKDTKKKGDLTILTVDHSRGFDMAQVFYKDWLLGTMMPDTVDQFVKDFNRLQKAPIKLKTKSGYGDMQTSSLWLATGKDYISSVYVGYSPSKKPLTHDERHYFISEEPSVITKDVKGVDARKVVKLGEVIQLGKEKFKVGEKMGHFTLTRVGKK